MSKLQSVGLLFFPLEKDPLYVIINSEKEFVMSMPAKNLKLDAKKRITLGKIVPSEVTSYDVELKDNGIIVLYPKVEIPAEDLWLFQNKNALKSLKRGLEQFTKGEVTDLSDDFWNELEE